MNYDLLARLVFYGAGLFSCWAIYVTLRDNWTRIKEIIDGRP